MQATRTARPARIRVRLWDPPVPGAIPLELPARNMRLAAVAFAVFFAIFAAVEWSAVSGLFDDPINDVSDLAFWMFHAFWALGWSVGVMLLGALTILFAFYSESARLEGGTLIHIAKLGPMKIRGDYDLASVRNVRLEQASGNDPDTVQLCFDYEGGANTLGNAMSRLQGQRLVDAIAAAARFVPRAVDARPLEPQTAVELHKPAPRAERPLPLTSESALALVGANLVPVVGVLFFDWDLGNILVLYWVESGVIAFYTVLKIAIVGKLGAIVAAPFFMGHFGGFMAGHFLLIYALFLRGRLEWTSGISAELSAIFFPIWASIAALFISHGVSFYTNFLGEREDERATVKGLMTAPYQRIIVMHLTLIFGGWIVMLLGMPVGALVVLLLLKTAADLQAHRAEHLRVT